MRHLRDFLTSHPRIAHGQRYPMPCLEWSAEEVEGEQGSGPKGPMSCRTQRWISIMKTKFIRQKQRKSLPLFHTSWEGIFEVFGAIFYDIQWEFCILSIYYQFSMGISYFSYFLVNYLCYSMGNLYFFTYYSMGGLHFANFPCYSMGIWGLKAFGGGDGRTDRRMDWHMDGRMEIHPCVLQDFGPLGQLPKKGKYCLFFYIAMSIFLFRQRPQRADVL